MAGFFSSGGTQTQTTTLPSAGFQEQGMYDQLYGLAGQQASSLGSQGALYRALMNPQQSLQILNSASPYGPGGQTETYMRSLMGNEVMDRFMAGGGTGKGLTPEEFDTYKREARAFANSDLRDIDSPDLRMKLQQQIAQNQMGQEAQAAQLDRLQNPYQLSTQEQQGINSIFDAQQSQALYNLNQQVQDMATSRGLNKYDSPVSNPLSQAVMQLQSNLAASRAGAMLDRSQNNRDYGLNLMNSIGNLNAQQFGMTNQINQMTPAANTALLSPLLQQRMAQGTTTGSSTQTPSMFDTIMRGVGAAGGMMMGAGGMMSGLGALGGASAGGANLGLSSYLATTPGQSMPFKGLSGSYGG